MYTLTAPLGQYRGWSVPVGGGNNGPVLMQCVIRPHWNWQTCTVTQLTKLPLPAGPMGGNTSEP